MATDTPNLPTPEEADEMVVRLLGLGQHGAMQLGDAGDHIGWALERISDDHPPENLAEEIQRSAAVLRERFSTIRTEYEAVVEFLDRFGLAAART